ncbi:MAG: ABC transporter permease [Alcaligenaceae bacterium]|nr:ABC transporter permease [Alcaligenaceae bacterium]
MSESAVRTRNNKKTPSHRALLNIWLLGIKEFWSLLREPMMLILIVYMFSLSIYSSAKAIPDTLNHAAIAIVDEDQSMLSTRIVAAFYPPYFTSPKMITYDQMDVELDNGSSTFVLNIPHGLQRRVLSGEPAEVQLNIDATRMSQAFTGNGYISQIINQEVTEFAQRYRGEAQLPVELSLRARFNPVLDPTWFGGIVQVVNNISMLSLILTGAALIRERERGTIEHLLVMPVTSAEIMMSKIWSMSVVVLVAALSSLIFVVQKGLGVPIEGSILLFAAGAAVFLFSITSMGIFMATIANNMPQFAMLLIITLMPMQMLSGGVSPRESMPDLVQYVMLLAPTSHFIDLSQAILFRGAGFDVVWVQFVALAAIGMVLNWLSLRRFKEAIVQMA